MSLTAAMIDAMIASGCSAEQIGAVVKAGIAEAEVRREAKRENNAERQRRFRAKRSSRKSNARNALPPVTPPIEELHTPGSVVSPDGETQNGTGNPFPKPDWAEAQLWADFLKNRQRKKAPNTATAYAGFLADIDRLTDDEWPPPRLLRHATAKGWAGIYDPRDKQNDRAATSNDELQNPYARRVVARQAERAAAVR